MFWLSEGEEIMTLAFFILIQYRSVTDRQTDIPPLAIPTVCIARYANALVKSEVISVEVRRKAEYKNRCHQIGSAQDDWTRHSALVKTD